MARSDATLKRYYKLINRKFFHNELLNNICCRYANDDDEDDEPGCQSRYYGWCVPAYGPHKYTIVLSRIKNPGWPAKLSTLAHEMIHCVLDLKDDHGPAFSAWHEKLTERGLFRKNAVLHGLTLF
jgi:hypothetical protein